MGVLVGHQAPEIASAAVMPDGTINENFTLSDYRGQYVVLFFWPLDFTFVCPSEIVAHDNRVKEFEARNVQLIGCSIDSEFTHFAWRNTARDQGGIGEVQFPLVSDKTHKIVQDYGIAHPQDGVALRASFLIDKDGVVQHQVINNLPLGREVNEMLRMVDALQFTEEHGEVCPAGWQKGQAGMKPDAEGVASYLSEHADAL